MSEAHFGRWIERLRHRIGIKSQAEFAELLGLESREAIYHMQLRKARGISGVALESLLDILGVQREEDLDALWKAGTFPDMGEVRERVRRLKPGLVIHGVRAGAPVMAVVDALKPPAEVASQLLDELAALADDAGISDDEVIAYFRKKKARSVPGIRTGTDQAHTPKAAAHHSDAARRRVEEKRRRPR